MVFRHYIRILSSVAMSTCDALLRHVRKMLLYTQEYAVAYSHLLPSWFFTVHGLSELYTTIMSVSSVALQLRKEKK